MTIYEYLESIQQLNSALGHTLQIAGVNDTVQVVDSSIKYITLAADARCKLLVVHRTAQATQIEVELGERASLTMAVLYPQGGEGTECKVQVVLDADLANYKTICMHPNDNTGSTYLSYEDLLKFIQKTNHEPLFYKV